MNLIINRTKNKILAIAITSLCSLSAQADSAVLDWQTLNKQFSQTQLEQFDANKNLQAFQEYLNAHPDNALAQLYVGSSYCLVGRDAWMPWNKINAVNTCIDKMEVAYQNVQTHYSETSSERLNADLTFGLTTAALPDRFKQQQSTIDTLNHALQHPGFNLLPESTQEKTNEALADYQQR